jgi:HSP20 family molecular chaperone IbpA
VDVPGADREHVQITLEKNVLTIQAETGMQHPEGYTMVLSEYGIGDYTRSFVLTDVIDQEKIEATVTDGVLKLVLPKAGPAKTHQIKISTGN